MKTYWLLAVVLLVGLIIPTSATQYNPPWAHCYGFNTQDQDTTPYSTNAANSLSSVGYQSYAITNPGATVGFNNLKDDAIFYYFGHGSGGALHFNNTTTSYIVADLRGGGVPVGDYHVLSSTTTELKDVLLAVYESCNSGTFNIYWGNLVDVSYNKGIDNVIGFSALIYTPGAEYWSERFWYRCVYGATGTPQRITPAANGATMDVLMEYGEYFGLNSKYVKTRTPLGDYISPARYGVV